MSELLFDGISVIIPVFNKEDTLSRAIKSVVGQTGCKYELIIIDDGSTDKSFTVATSFKNNYISVFQKENGGPSLARNFGAEKSSFRYLIFLDADDHLPLGTLKGYREKFTEDSTLDLCISSFQVVDGIKEYSVSVADRFEDGSSFIALNAFDHRAVVNIGSGSFCVARKLFDKAGGFDRKLRCWEITDFLIRANIFSKKKIILSDIGLIIEKIENGQFFKTQHNSEQRHYYASNIFNYLEMIPENQHEPFIRELKINAIFQWEHGELFFFKQACLYYSALGKISRDIPPLRLLLLIAGLPNFFINMLMSIRANISHDSVRER